MDLTPSAPGAQLAMGLGAAGYRTFVDPLMVTPQARGGGGSARALECVVVWLCAATACLRTC